MYTGGAGPGSDDGVGDGHMDDEQLREDFSRYISLPNNFSLHDDEQDHEQHEQQEHNHSNNNDSRAQIRAGSLARNSQARRSTGDCTRVAPVLLRRHRASSADELESGSFDDLYGYLSPRQGGVGAQRAWSKFDAQIMQPLFGGAVVSLSGVMSVETAEPIEASLPSSDQSELLASDSLDAARHPNSNNADTHSNSSGSRSISDSRQIESMYIDVGNGFGSSNRRTNSNSRRSRSANASPSGIELKELRSNRSGGGGGGETNNRSSNSSLSAYAVSPPRSAGSGSAS
jgi:hypothetical protein